MMASESKNISLNYLELDRKPRTADWLDLQDKQYFIDEVGLMRTAQVDSKSYEDMYFSDAHLAYVDGYTLDGRLKKYADAIENISQLLPQSIIDLGCGPGFIVEGLRREDILVKGVDVSKKAIYDLSPETTRHLLNQAPLTNLPFIDNQFKSGYSFHVLEHLTIKEIKMALTEISRVVENNLYLIIPTWDSLSDRELFNQIILDPTHRVIVTREWWIKKFAEYGWIHNDSKAKKLDRIDRGWVFFFER